jgi:hypothetical protein
MIMNFTAELLLRSQSHCPLSSRRTEVAPIDTGAALFLTVKDESG